MCQNENRQIGTEPTSRPVLVNIFEMFGNANNRQDGLVEQIQEKLHKILNLRTPEAESKSAKDGNIQDANSEFNIQISRLDRNNDKLSSILRHLEQII